jgi:ribosomal protein S4
LGSKFEKKWLRRRFSEELRIKQSLKFFYGPIREKFFRKYLLLSINNKTKQNSQEILVQRLELRLDSFLKRRCLFDSIFQSRQNILHNKILLCKSNEINFSFIRKPNYQVQIGDLFKIESAVELVNLNSNFKYFKIIKKNGFIYLLVIKQPIFDELHFSFKLNLKDVFNWGRRY